jgi:transcriptional regulator with XRE-family HTH domain
VDAGEQFGHNLRSHRKRASLTQEDLAHAAGVHPSEVSRLESAHRDPRLSTIVRLAAALGVSPASLLERTGADES